MQIDKTSLKNYYHSFHALTINGIKNITEKLKRINAILYFDWPK